MKWPQHFGSRQFWIGYALYLAWAFGFYYLTHWLLWRRSHWAFWVAWFAAMVIGSTMGSRTERLLKARSAARQ